MRPRAIAKHVGILPVPSASSMATSALGVIESLLQLSHGGGAVALAFLFPKMKNGGEARAECQNAGSS